MQGHICLIVRRFSHSGGMERYVWELSKELVLRGIGVTVICEVFEQKALSMGVEIVSVGNSSMPFGWLRLLHFSRKVSHAIKELKRSDLIIHSHERTGIHHVTTFHGSVFARVLTRSIIRRLSPRILAFLWMERREIFGAKVQFVIPNSYLTRESLECLYPHIGSKVIAPIAPGVALVPQRPFSSVKKISGVIGFVGKEYKRKGLLFFLSIVRALLVTRSNLTVKIFGPERREIAHLIPEVSNAITFCGWVDTTRIYSELDLLVHPAHDEPYGMCVAEAMAAGVPVVVSSASGVSRDVSELNGSVLDIDQPLQDWVSACEYWLRITEEPPAYKRSWATVADEYIAVYKRVKL